MEIQTPSKFKKMLFESNKLFICMRISPRQLANQVACDIGHNNKPYNKKQYCKTPFAWYWFIIKTIILQYQKKM